MNENSDEIHVRRLLEEQREVLRDLGFSNPLISLGSSRADTGFEVEQSQVDLVSKALMSGSGRLAAVSNLCCGVHRDGASFLDRLRHIGLNAEALEADVGLNLLKVAVGAIVWRDQDRKEREAPIWLRSVRIVGDEWVGEGPVEINADFLARATAAGLALEIPSNSLDLNSVVVREDKARVFVRVKNRAVFDLFATTKLALWKSLDADARPEILTKGALRLLAGAPAVKMQWSPSGENRHIVPCDPAQDSVISAARRGESFSVQGPPGTGKSQTIVNVVSNLVLDDRRVLVAADKVPAIQVVASRLSVAGIPFQLMLGNDETGDHGARVVLTTPATAARYLPPEEVFDFVVVDEASQLPLPNALSIATRADRILVFGDARQMGPNLRAYQPTAKSSKAIELTSTLDQCANIGLPEKVLTHHYRSRHPDLILFSDLFSYGSTLLTSPHPTVNQNFGVFLYRLMGVTADETGGSIVNRYEAAAIVDLVLKRIDALEARGISLGIIAMNRAQRDLIAGLLTRELAKKGKTIADLSRVPGEPLFVRSVDSIQGEERDVVILSLTYGRKPNGELPQILGPFSAKDGLQKINVAMSRSRMQTYVVTSLQETDLEPARRTSHALYNALIRTADCFVEPYFLPKTHPLAKMAERHNCRVQFLEGVFAFLHERYAERFLLGVYLSGLRGELEDAAELARLKGLEWRLEVVDGSSAYERSRIEDYFASWDWPLALLEERLSDAVLAERFKPF